MTTFDIDGDLVRKLAELLRETGLAEVEFQEGDRRIRVTRSHPVSTVAVAAPAAAPAVAAAPATAPRHTTGAPPPGAITSPMVGTAYVAAEPGGPPFVRVGDQVKAGQTVIIIEAMKVMNPIKAPRNGTVTEMLVADGQPVEFGEVMLVVE